MPDAGVGSRRPPPAVDPRLPVGAVVSQLVTVAVVVLLARMLKPTGVGLYIQAYAVLALLSALCLAGARSSLSATVAFHRAHRDGAGLRGAIALGVALPTGAAVLLAGLLSLTAPALLRALSLDARLGELLRLVAVALVFAVFTDCALAATRGFSSTRYFALISLIAEPLLRLVLTADLLAVGAGIRGALIALVVSHAVAAVVAGWALWRLLDPTGERPRYDLREVNLAPLSWLGALATTGLVWGDVLLIGALRSSVDAGIYAVATRLVALAALALPPILSAATPAFLQAAADGTPDAAQHRFASTTGWMARLALPGLVALIVLPRDLLALFGPGFAAAATAMVVLAAGKLVDGVTGPTALMLTLTGRPAINVMDNVAAVLLNIGLNLYLIPRHGIVGAAIAWTVAICALNVTRVVQVRRLTGIVPFGVGSLRALVAGNAALLATLLISHLLTAPWRLPLGLLDVAVTYLAVTAALGFTVEETAGLRRLRHRAGLRFAR